MRIVTVMQRSVRRDKAGRGKYASLKSITALYTMANIKRNTASPQSNRSRCPRAFARRLGKLFDSSRGKTATPPQGLLRLQRDAPGHATNIIASLEGQVRRNGAIGDWFSRAAVGALSVWEARPRFRL
jgi:hypothetical protein